MIQQIAQLGSRSVLVGPRNPPSLSNRVNHNNPALIASYAHKQRRLEDKNMKM